MQTYELLVRNRSVEPNSEDTTLVRTSVGVDRMHVMFDNAEWSDFPITVTFANGEVIRSMSLPVSPLESDEWVLEGECVIPWEVIRDVGQIRVTFQGTDAGGNHIITAAGAPLSVEESGDSEMGDIPEDAPTVDQWNQAYADAAAAANSANAAAAAALEAIEAIEASTLPVATTESAGVVKPDGVTAVVDAGGTLSVSTAYVLPIADEYTLGGVMVDVETIDVDGSGVLSLSDAYKAAVDEAGAVIDATFNVAFEDGELASATVKPAALPVATQLVPGAVRPDGETITVDANGMLTAGGAASYELPTATRNRLGGVKVDGSTITADADGTIHGSSTYELPKATTSTLGGVKPDGTTITADADGTIHGASTYELPVASASQLGGVKPDGSTITIDSNGVISGASRDDFIAVRVNPSAAVHSQTWFWPRYGFNSPLDPESGRFYMVTDPSSEFYGSVYRYDGDSGYYRLVRSSANGSVMVGYFNDGFNAYGGGETLDGQEGILYVEWPSLDLYIYDPEEGYVRVLRASDVREAATAGDILAAFGIDGASASVSGETLEIVGATMTSGIVDVGTAATVSSNIIDFG